MMSMVVAKQYLQSDADMQSDTVFPFYFEVVNNMAIEWTIYYDYSNAKSAF